MPAPLAAWSMTVPTRSVQDDGTALIVAEFADADGPAGTLTMTMTPERALSVTFTVPEGGPEPTGFRAWVKAP